MMAFAKRVSEVVAVNRYGTAQRGCVAEWLEDMLRPQLMRWTATRLTQFLRTIDSVVWWSVWWPQEHPEHVLVQGSVKAHATEKVASEEYRISKYIWLGDSMRWKQIASVLQIETDEMRKQLQQRVQACGHEMVDTRGLAIGVVDWAGVG